MSKLLIRELTLANFAKYGFFTNVLNVTGVSFESRYYSFFRDVSLMKVGTDMTAFSVCIIKKRPFVIDILEQHSKTHEAFISLDGDALLQVAPASQNGIPPMEDIEVFFVPKGILITLKCGVWHHAPFAYGCASSNILVVLPERTYANDCTTYEIEERCRPCIELDMHY